jgi:hypothetical protein
MNVPSARNTDSIIARLEDNKATHLLWAFGSLHLGS